MQLQINNNTTTDHYNSYDTFNELLEYEFEL